MKNIGISLGLPTLVRINDKTELVSSMVLSTFVACVLTTFVPQLMPLWMAMATGLRL
jgi:hypothetical protein